MKFKKIRKFLASLQLAVIIIISLSVLIAIGTIIESRLDATAASKLIYRTWWMYSIMGLLVVNLTAVMTDRWPWQKKHTPFILAHIGIITLLLGSLITANWGLDGSMIVGVGTKSNFVTIPVTDLTMYTSFDGQNYTKLFSREVDFFKQPPQKNKISFALDQGEFQVLDYAPYALASKKVRSSASLHAGCGIRFQLSNPNVNFSEWLVQEHVNQELKKDLGPASVHVGAIPRAWTGKNEIYLAPLKSKVKYGIFYRDKNRKTLRGLLSEGETVATGWVGLQFKLLRFLPQAEEAWEFQRLERPTPDSTSAILVSFMGKEHWLQVDDILKFFTEKAAYILSYGNRRIDLGFDIFLKKFEVGRHQGTMMASSYKSHIEVSGAGEAVIAMNEPLKHQGLTFYQASFQQDQSGNPIARIFSVNFDPGRWVKYLGSFLIVFGSVLLFYNKRKSSRSMAPKTTSEVIK